MTGSAVGVAEMLSARDRRAQMQRELILEHSLPVVSFTMNIAGEIKRSPVSDLLFGRGVEMLEERFGRPLARIVTDENTGLEELMVYDLPADELKRGCMELEERFPAARLFDLDVIGPDGIKLKRDSERLCIVCGGRVTDCARSRAHGLDTVKSRTQALLLDWLPDALADYAVKALRDEAMLSPKPGLVDALDSGAHKDMSLDTLLKSADSLRPFFRQAALLGVKAADCMPPLRAAGMMAEERMLRVTGGVNTHRGAIYILGLLTAGLGRCACTGSNPFDFAAALAGSSDNLLPGSHGEQVRKNRGGSGAVAEARNGFPCAREGYEALARGESELDALMRIMLICDDSNLYYRGGQAALDFAREWALKVLSRAQTDRTELLNEMNREFIKRNLSPGGCADSLAAALLMYSARALFI